MQTIDNAKLKIIAMTTMLIDHIGASLIERSSLMSLPEWQMIDTFLRMIGRIAFPLYCFMLVEAFLHTKNRKKYILSFLIMSIVTEPFFDMAFFGAWNPEYQNVLFTLLIGFLTIWGISKLDENISQKNVRFIATIFIVAIACVISEILKTDYTYTGVLLIAILYTFQADVQKILKCILGSVLFIGTPTAMLAFILIYRYNGEKGTLCIPHWFYRYFYPIHLAILAGVQMIVLAGA